MIKVWSIAGFFGPRQSAGAGEDHPVIRSGSPISSPVDGVSDGDPPGPGGPTRKYAPDPSRLGRDAPVVVFETDDVVLAKIIPALHFDDNEWVRGGVRQPVLVPDRNKR